MLRITVRVRARVRCLEVLDDKGHVVVPPARVLKFPLRALLLLLRQLRVHLWG